MGNTFKIAWYRPLQAQDAQSADMSAAAWWKEMKFPRSTTTLYFILISAKKTNNNQKALAVLPQVLFTIP